MNGRRNAILFVTATTFAVFVFGGCRQGTGTREDVGVTEKAKIKVGVLTILTGESSSYGEYTKQGLELALAEIETPGFQLVYKNTKGDPVEAIRVLRELERDDVPVTIGPFTSTEVRQVGSEAQRMGMTLISSSATADDLSAIGDHIFMMLPPNSQQGRDQATFALIALNAQRAAVLYRQNPYGETLRESFSKAFTDGGGEIVSDIGFPDGEENFRDRLKTTAGSKPDVIFIPSHDTDTGRILRQAREVNLPETVRFLGCDGSMSESMLELAGDSAEGAIFSNVASISTEFDDAYAAKHGDSPSPYAASSYDTLLILHQLIQQGASTGDDFQGGLVNLTDYSGATGVTTFSKIDKSYWALSKSYSQFEVRQGKFELVESTVAAGSN